MPNAVLKGENGDLRVVKIDSDDLPDFYRLTISTCDLAKLNKGSEESLHIEKSIEIYQLVNKPTETKQC